LINFSAVCLSIIPHFDGEVKQANTRYCFYFWGYQQYFVLYSFCSICLRPGKVCFCQARAPSFNSNFFGFYFGYLAFSQFFNKNYPLTENLPQRRLLYISLQIKNSIVNLLKKAYNIQV